MASTHQHLISNQVWSDTEHGVPESWYLMTGGSTIRLRSLQLRMPNARYPTRPPVECTVKLLCLTRQIGKPSGICRGFLFQAPSHSMCTLSPPLLHPHKGLPASSFYANLCARSAFTRKDAKVVKHNRQAAEQSEFLVVQGVA